MASIFDKVTNVVKNENIFNDFLNFTYEINHRPWCRDREDHSPDWCGEECTILKFLIPIISKMKKKNF